jgi:hypothetical protein
VKRQNATFMTLAPVNPDQNVNRAANRICRAIALHSRSGEAGSEGTGVADAGQRRLFMRMGLFFIDFQTDRCGACTIRRFADLMAPRYSACRADLRRKMCV